VGLHHEHSSEKIDAALYLRGDRARGYLVLKVFYLSRRYCFEDNGGCYYPGDKIDP
jgi:hypothetical protein